MSSTTPLRAALLNAAGCRELQCCLREACSRVPRGCKRKADLIASIDESCRDPVVHDRVCARFLQKMTLPVLRVWLLCHAHYLQGRCVREMGRTKAEIIDNVVTLARPPNCGVETDSSSDKASRAIFRGPPQEPAEGMGLQLVAVGSSADPSRSRFKLAKRWLKKARKRLAKQEKQIQGLAARKAVSRKVRAALKETLQMSDDFEMQMNVREIRTKTSAAAEICLDHGHAKIFFDRCLASCMKGRQTRKRALPVRLGASLVSTGKRHELKDVTGREPRSVPSQSEGYSGDATEGSSPGHCSKDVVSETQGAS